MLRVPTSPSNALAILAYTMAYSSPLVLTGLGDELEKSKADVTPPRDWLSSGVDLCTKVATMIGDWPPPPPLTAEAFARYCAALQRLDRWHRPLLPSETNTPRLPEHEALLSLAASNDRFNTNPDFGSVIARQALSRPFLRFDDNDPNWKDMPSPYAALSALLDVCAFLPPDVPAGPPDTESSTTGCRHIRLVFQSDPQKFSFGLDWSHQDLLRIAFAPVAEAEKDACLRVKDDHYAIEPKVQFERLRELIKEAFAKHVHLLLLPEATVDAAYLPKIATTLRQLSRAALRANPVEMPSLRLALIGVSEIPQEEKGCHSNRIVAFNTKGEVLFTQDKLSHWNLGPKAQSRFGFAEKGYPTLLHEDTSPGEEITVVDFEGFGRIMALICADMNKDMPGDWIADNIGLDWLYAPIMDGSTCWSQGDCPWIIKRALRSCSRNGTSVLVANSMVMTHWNNSAISHHKKDPTYLYKLYTSCGIGLAVRQGEDGQSPEIQHVTVDLSPPSSPVLRIIDWDSGWAAPPDLPDKPHQPTDMTPDH